MTSRGYERDFAERCFRQIEGFGEYGFPESHAASFAHLAYVSSWLKCHYPAVFACALLNSQPMGFYAPAQIVRDARDHGVEVRPTDVNHSDWDCSLEAGGGGPDDGHRARLRDHPTGGPLALRLGLRRIRGMKEDDADRVTAAREDGYRSPHELRQRAGIPPSVLSRLARADAFTSMGLDRRQAAWAVRAMSEAGPLPLFDSAEGDRAAGDRSARDDGRIRPEPALPTMSVGEHVAADYRTTGLSLKQHPVGLLRGRLDEREILPAQALEGLSDGDRAVVAGIVLTRQRPGKGIVMFITLEDETGTANLVVFPSVYERQRRETLTARLMVCHGKVQKVDGVIHVIAERVGSLNNWLDELGRAGSGRAAPGDVPVEGVSRGGVPSGSASVAGSGHPRKSFVGRGRFFH